jgi:hypothetical protein
MWVITCYIGDFRAVAVRKVKETEDFDGGEKDQWVEG